MPHISVIVPIYQAQALLRPCVESVLAQSFESWELLLIDDGSRDASPRLCDAFAAGDGRIRVFHKENGGVSSARNLGLAQARGRCIVFLDADDALCPDALDTFWRLRQDTGADSVGCAHINVSPAGGERTETLLPEGVYGPAAIREKILWPLTGDRLRPPIFNGFIWRFAFDAETVRRHALAFEGAYLEDELFLMEYFAHAEKLAVTQRPLYRYLENPASVTHRYMPDYPAVFDAFLHRKTQLVEHLGLFDGRPQWRTDTLWAGLLIAVANEYAKSNPAAPREKRRAVEALCRQAGFAAAIREMRPRGLGRNKQVVADLICRGRFGLLTALYRLKNRW